jgi:hypothetical protein
MADASFQQAAGGINIPCVSIAHLAIARSNFKTLLQIKVLKRPICPACCVPFQSKAHKSSPLTTPPPACSNRRTYLQIKVLGGTAFTDYLVRAPLQREQLCLSLECFGKADLPITFPLVTILPLARSFRAASTRSKT